MAIAVIVILSIALGVALILNRPSDTSNSSDTNPTPTETPDNSSTPNPPVVTYDFEMSLDAHPSLNIIQGESDGVGLILTTVSGDDQTVNPDDVMFSADSGSSGIECSFEGTDLLASAMGIKKKTDANGSLIPNGFSNLLLVTVPQSTPTKYYAIIVTAKIGSVSHSISILVGVESSTVTVSGTVNSSFTPYQIQFMRNNIYDYYNYQKKYYATLTGNTYSIVLSNQENYVVSVSDGKGEWYTCSSDFWLGRDFYLEVPAGSTSITKDFTAYEVK